MLLLVVFLPSLEKGFEVQGGHGDSTAEARMWGAGPVP